MSVVSRQDGPKCAKLEVGPGVESVCAPSQCPLSGRGAILPDVDPTLVLVNPRAGGGRGIARWQAVCHDADAIAELSVVVPKDAAGTVAAVAEAVGDGCRRVVVFGGDGTVRLVADTLLRLGAAGDVTIGVIPAGTGADFARALGVPRDRRQALAPALTGIGRPLDVGAIDGGASGVHGLVGTPSDRGFVGATCGDGLVGVSSDVRALASPGAAATFVNIASFGLSGEVARAVNAVPNRGGLTFLAATVRAFRRFEPCPVRVSVDGTEVATGPALLVAIANGTTFGRGMRIAPNASLTDGLLDVIIVAPIPAWALAWRLPQLYLGRHLKAAPVRVFRGATVVVEPESTAPAWELDGEPGGAGRRVVRVRPGAMRIVTGSAVAVPSAAGDDM